MRNSALLLCMLFGFAGCQDQGLPQSTVSVPVVSAPMGDEERVSESTPFNATGAPTVVLSIPNMHCESCVAKTTEVLLKQPGVVEVQVDLEAKRATLVVEETSFDSKLALAVLEDYGFDHSTLLTAPLDSPESVSKYSTSRLDP